MSTFKTYRFLSVHLMGLIIIIPFISFVSNLGAGIMENKKESQEQKIIHVSDRLDCDAHHAFEMFTVNEYIQSWLPEYADVEPVVGGKYELFWEPDNRQDNSTIGCKVTAVEQDKFISFEWKGPVQFKHIMNNVDPLTHVIVFFIPCGAQSSPQTEVHLIHSGWRKTGEWAEAILFFEQAWDRAFDKLRSVVNDR